MGAECFTWRLNGIGVDVSITGQVRPLYSVSDTERAWAAGYFDGEGCVTVQGRSVRVQIGCTERHLLVRFQRAVGGIGRIYGPYYPFGNRQPTFHYRAGANALRHIAPLLWPYLDSTKRAKMAAGLVAMHSLTQP